MTKGIFITATGTDIGKTYVTGLIVKALKNSGKNAGYYKAALSGAEEINGKMTAGDAYHVLKTAGIDKNANNTVSYIYKNAVSPHFASQIEGNPVCMKKVCEDFKSACKEYDYITVEGSGGIVCPIRWDTKKILLEDIIKSLGLSAVIVADAGLGTINSVVLTVEYMQKRNIEIKGIILNHYNGNLMQNDNIKMIEEITKIPVIACVRDNDTEIIDLSKYYSSIYTS